MYMMFAHDWGEHGDGVFLDLDPVIDELLDCLERVSVFWFDNGIIVFGYYFNYFQIGVAAMWVWFTIAAMFPWLNESPTDSGGDAEGNELDEVIGDWWDGD